MDRNLSLIFCRNNDFIFAVLTEELGLLGSGIVLFLFLALFFRLRIIAQSAPDNFGFLLTGGIIIMLFVQMLVNVGMNVGLVPVTGISLPFLSYGGSFLLTVFAAIGIVMNISSSRERLALSEKID
jgi:cell division protein FtsW (lipid II flippase)